jgi:Zn ribbon nucleic-acid-binding protein
MGQIILRCRECNREIAFPVTAVREGVTCPGCGKAVPLRMDPTIENQHFVRNCVSCGHDTLYIQKDFNRTVGVGIVILGSLVSLFFFSRSQPILGMLALFVSAGIDFLIYSLVGEVTVCYACHAIYRGLDKNPDHSSFELTELEKYGGRDPRF